MRFSDLYASLIERWPLVIPIEDAHPPAENRQLFPSLNAVYCEIEDRIDHKTDHWASLGQWSLSQAFHQVAKANYARGIKYLETRTVALDLINSKIERNLTGEDWEAERAVYQPFPE